MAGAAVTAGSGEMSCGLGHSVRRKAPQRSCAQRGSALVKLPFFRQKIADQPEFGPASHGSAEDDSLPIRGPVDVEVLRFLRKMLKSSPQRVIIASLPAATKHIAGH